MSLPPHSRGFCSFRLKRLKICIETNKNIQELLSLFLDIIIKLYNLKIFLDFCLKKLYILNNLVYNNIALARKRAYLGVAQFGSALEWGSRGRKFKSSHSDQKHQFRRRLSAEFFIFACSRASGEAEVTRYANRLYLSRLRRFPFVAHISIPSLRSLQIFSLRPP